MLVVEAGSVRVCLAECPSLRFAADQLRDGRVVILIVHPVDLVPGPSVQNNITAL